MSNLHCDLIVLLELGLTTTQQPRLYRAAPERGEGFIGNPLSNFYGSLSCPVDRHCLGLPGLCPHPMNAAREKCLAKGQWLYKAVMPSPRLEPGPSDSQSSALSTTLPDWIVIWYFAILHKTRIKCVTCRHLVTDIFFLKNKKM